MMKLTEKEKELLELELISLEEIKIRKGLLERPKYKKNITKHKKRIGFGKTRIITITEYERID